MGRCRLVDGTAGTGWRAYDRTGIEPPVDAIGSFRARNHGTWKRRNAD